MNNSEDEINSHKASYFKLFYLGARPKTLPAAISPVLVGTALGEYGHFDNVSIVKFLLCVAVALSLQVGVNYANDYSDGIRGADKNRVGPLRLVGSGLVDPKYVKYAAFACGLVAAVAGLILAVITSLWLIVVGLVSLLAAWGYSGGPKPYGYMALGELSVLVFFGLVATVGSYYSQTLKVDFLSFIGGISVGLLACSILVANNLRDIDGDSASHKNTLAVLIGEKATRVLFVVVSLIGILLSIAIAYMTKHYLAIIALASLILFLKSAIAVLKQAKGSALIPVLKNTALLELIFSVLLAVGLFIN